MSIQNPEEQPEKAERIISIICDNCGADMVYSAEHQKLHCDHCNHTRELPDENNLVVEKSFSEGLQLNESETGFGIETKIFHCNACGAETAVDAGKAGIQCPFCGSENVNEEAHQSRIIKPSGILPFKIDRKVALAEFKTWIKKGWFHPNALKKMAKVDQMNGVYLPWWTFDAFTQSNWTAMAGYYYYVTETYTDSNGNTSTRQVQKTRWVPASGYYEHSFDDVLVMASNGLKQNAAKSIEPFTLGEVVNYEPQYILGWNSEVYQKDVKEGFEVGEGIMDSFIRSACTNQIPGDTHRSLSVKTRKSRITFKHILLPVWIAGYRFGGKTFQFLVNGQTGKVAGKKPISVMKIVLLVLVLALIGGAIWLFASEDGQAFLEGLQQ